jgi:hypothetical protein
MDKMIGTLKKTFLPHEGPLDPIVLYDALHCDEFWEDDWMCTSDKSYGGPSHAKLIYAVDTPSTNQNDGKYLSKDEEDDGSRSSTVSADIHGNHAFSGFPFMRFEGSLDMSVRKSQELGVSGGFCAVRWVLK